MADLGPICIQDWDPETESSQDDEAGLCLADAEDWGAELAGERFQWT